jgi:hypothetical protein
MKTVTGMGGMGGARELAEMLRQMGRGPDTVLAHITPEEAEMLMRMGGSGDMNPNTGLPEFQPEYGELLASETYGNEPVYQEPDYGQLLGSERDFSAPVDFAPQPSMAPAPAPTAGFEPMGMDIGFGPGQFAPPVSRGDITGMPQDQFERFMGEPEPSAFTRGAQAVEGGVQRVRDLATRYPNIAGALGLAGQTVPGLLMAQRAQREGRRAAEELRALGQPLRESGEALRQQALAGGLTPQQARQQEASRARLRQQASGRGALTGTQQAMIENTLARERAGLAEVNLNNAIKQLNLANAYDEAAIRARLISDRQVAESLANVYSNLSRSVAGRPTQQVAGTQQQPILPEESVTRRPEVRG